jgi:hypothetical protein
MGRILLFPGGKGTGFRFFDSEMFEDAHVEIGAKGRAKEVPASLRRDLLC